MYFQLKNFAFIINMRKKNLDIIRLLKKQIFITLTNTFFLQFFKIS